MIGRKKFKLRTYLTPDILKYYNISLIDINFINQSTFYLLCKFDYYSLVEILFNNNNIDLNMKINVILYIYDVYHVKFIKFQI